MPKNICIALLLLSLGTLTSCSIADTFNPNTAMTASQTSNAAAVSLDSPAFWQGSTTTVWNNLQHNSLAKLQTAASQTTDANNIAWIKLAMISKQYSTNTPELVNQLIAWRSTYPSHPGNALFPDNSTLTSIVNTPPPKHLALLLPLQGPLAPQGRAVRDGFLGSYYAAQSRLSTPQTLSFYDTSQNKDVVTLYQQAIAEGADAVIGPLTKENVQELTQKGTFPVPTLALNYTDIWFGSLPAHLYQFGLSPQDEAQQVADKAKQAGRSRALIIAPQSAWGQRVVSKLTAQWKSLGGTVTDTFFFTPQTDFSESIPTLLHVHPIATDPNNPNDKTKPTEERRQDFDVIFLIAQPQPAREIVPLLKYHYAGNVPIYASSAVYSGKPDPQKDADLNGVFFNDIPWNLGASNASHNRLFAVGHDAYLLSQEIPRLTQLPVFPLYGATGALTLNAQHQVYRRLPWTQIHDGHP